MAEANTAAGAPAASASTAASTASSAPTASGGLPSEIDVAVAGPLLPQKGCRIAVVGCAHGELDAMYETIAHCQKVDSVQIDLLLCCGDFQSVRNLTDLSCLACPPKYRAMNTFYKYYSGECLAPVPTVFIGGNHEASNYLLELYHGGWVAPNIYYLGHAGVINFGGLRIAGLSGIFKANHFAAGHYESPPFSDSDIRSCYHVREYEVFRLLQIAKPIDIMMSHDWPRGIAMHGNTQDLLRRKTFLREEVQSNTLGNPPAEHLMKILQPAHWFSAHLHVKFAAVYKHDVTNRTTKFLALDKCMPHRDFLQILHFPDAYGPHQLSYDEEWLAIMRSTASFLSLNRGHGAGPGGPIPTAQRHSHTNGRFDFRPTEAELADIRKRFTPIPPPPPTAAPPTTPAAPATANTAATATSTPTPPATDAVAAVDPAAATATATPATDVPEATAASLASIVSTATSAAFAIAAAVVAARATAAAPTALATAAMDADAANPTPATTAAAVASTASTATPTSAPASTPAAAAAAGGESGESKDVKSASNTADTAAAAATALPALTAIASGPNYAIPHNFFPTAPSYLVPQFGGNKRHQSNGGQNATGPNCFVVNPQTTALLLKLDVDDLMAKQWAPHAQSAVSSATIAKTTNAILTAVANATKSTPVAAAAPAATAAPSTAGSTAVSRGLIPASVLLASAAAASAAAAATSFASSAPLTVPTNPASPQHAASITTASAGAVAAAAAKLTRNSEEIDLDDMSDEPGTTTVAPPAVAAAAAAPPPAVKSEPANSEEIDIDG